MKKYFCFLAMAFLLVRASTASAILCDYKSIAIAPEEVSGIPDTFDSWHTMAVNISVGSDYLYYNDFESIALQIVNEILEYPPYPPQIFKNLKRTAKSPIAEPSTILLMGIGLVGLARVCRNQFKKTPLHVSSTKATLSSATSG
jgi:hypothetical protein